jgi:acetyl esterase/lipase
VVCRQGSGITRLLTLLLIGGLIAAGCASAAGPATTQPATTTTPPTTTTSRAPLDTATTSQQQTTTTATSLEIDAEILAPEGEGPFPAVVLVHGGGWVAGAPSVIRSLARRLTEEGFLTVNTAYSLSSSESPGFPAALDDISCSVRVAQEHEDGDGTVTLIGHSAGAHLSAVVALTGDRYGAGCGALGSGLPDRLVGLAGPYDVDRLGILMLPFFGGGPQVEPDAWFAGNPMNLAHENPDLMSLLLHGDSDGIVEPSFTFDFGAALTGAGSEALVEIVEGADHTDLYDPDVVGDLIVTWLLR